MFSYVGGYFQFFTKNQPQKHQKRAILHTSQANGRAQAPPALPPPGYATGPTLANFFLGCLEEKLFANSNNLSPNLHLRNIDDIYAVFDSDSACTQFLDILNSQHKDIKFTLEKNTNRENLPILDVQIKLNDAGYDTCVWRKPTNTGLLLNFNALCPNTWKSGLIMCLLHLR